MMGPINPWCPSGGCGRALAGTAVEHGVPVKFCAVWKRVTRALPAWSRSEEMDAHAQRSRSPCIVRGTVAEAAVQAFVMASVSPAPP